MASLPPKAADSKKSPPKILSPSNGTADKTSTKSALKSPPSKLNSRSPSNLKSNDLGKNNLGLKSKMDSSSPPKVARSPSAKSITPPNKTPVKSPLTNSATKSALDKTNSDEEIAVNSGLKNGVSEIVSLDSANNEVTHVAEANPTEATLNGDVNPAPVPEQNVNDQDNTSRPESVSNDTTASTIANGNTPSDSCKILDSAKAVKPEPLDEQQIAISEQKHASGDSAPAVNDKVEHKDPSGEGASAADIKTSDKLENYENFTQHLSSSGVTLTVVSKKDKPEDKPATTDESPDLSSSQNDQASESVHSDESKKEDEIAKSSEDATGVSSTPKDSPDTTAEGANCSAETVKVADLENESDTAEGEVTKQSIRLKVWDHLEKNDLVLFPRPCKLRIPNFKGAHQAAEKLAGTKVFKNSKTIKVNPDKAQEMVRFHTLEHGKRLLVPIPRLREGLFQAVVPPTDASKYQLQQASQRYGMKKWSKPVSLDDKVVIDLLVLGSVAVDKKGHRIGKGEGFADLEFAMLLKMNAVNENTVIVTTVHDDQLHDELPDNLFKEHDVPVDWIITPTQIIEVAERLPRPKGIIWNILSNRRILEIPILQKLREQEISEGSECVLKEVDTDVEENTYPQESVFNKRFTRRRRFNNYSRSTGDPIRDSKLETGPAPFYNNRQRYSNQNRMSNYDDGRRYDGPPPHRRNYYQAPYGTKPQMNNRMPRQGRPRSMNRSGQPMNGPRNMNRPHSGARIPNDRRRNDYDDQMTKSVEVQTVDKDIRTSRPFIKRKRAPIEFSLRVKNIGTGVRVRDLKTALNERGIKPRDITWRGYRGFAFLHFVRNATKENKPLAVEDVIGALQGLPLPPKNKKPLVVEPAKPKKSVTDTNSDEETNVEAAANSTVTIETTTTATSNPVVAV